MQTMSGTLKINVADVALGVAVVYATTLGLLDGLHMALRVPEWTARHLMRHRGSALYRSSSTGGVTVVSRSTDGGSLRNVGFTWASG
jgi:hypothetical protein